MTKPKLLVVDDDEDLRVQMKSAHGGTIQVESEAGKGTTVRVSLPAGPEPGRRACPELERIAPVVVYTCLLPKPSITGYEQV